jgi:putative transposase
MVYLALLRDCVRKTGSSLHAYCLMSNHVHMLVTPPDAEACARLMRNLGQRYVQYFNRRYERTGTLWEGRPHSCIVDSAAYVLACYRYIEFNPVRAAMVESPAAYPWSSYETNACGAYDPMITPHAEYLALGREAASRQTAYAQLFQNSEDETFLATIRDATNGGYPLLGKELKLHLDSLPARRLRRQKSGPRGNERQGDDPPTLDLPF